MTMKTSCSFLTHGFSGWWLNYNNKTVEFSPGQVRCKDSLSQLAHVSCSISTFRFEMFFSLGILVKNMFYYANVGSTLCKWINFINEVLVMQGLPACVILDLNLLYYFLDVLTGWMTTSHGSSLCNACGWGWSSIEWPIHVSWGVRPGLLSLLWSNCVSDSCFLQLFYSVLGMSND